MTHFGEVHCKVTGVYSGHPYHKARGLNLKARIEIKPEGKSQSVFGEDSTRRVVKPEATGFSFCELHELY